MSGHMGAVPKSALFRAGPAVRPRRAPVFGNLSRAKRFLLLPGLYCDPPSSGGWPWWCNGAQMLLTMVGDLDLVPDVVVRERTQEED